jgi:hypothetical protein
MNKLPALLFIFGVAWTLSPSAPTYADDHLSIATTATGGKIDQTTMPDSPGQGAPFTGNDVSVPASAVREEAGAQRDFPGVGPSSGTAPNGQKFK